MDEESDSWIPPSAQPCTNPSTEDAAQKCLKRKNATPEPTATRLIKQSRTTKRIHPRSQIGNSGQKNEQQSRIRRPIRIQKNGTVLPSRRVVDHWNLNSDGHQHAENELSGSTVWRESRETKLAKQFEGGRGGGIRMSDAVGTGAPGGGKRGVWIESIGHELDPGQRTIEQCFDSAGKSKGSLSGLQSNLPLLPATTPKPISDTKTSDLQNHELVDSPAAPSSDIFANTVIYINGSTLPFMSDHNLRYLIVQNGGTMASALLRKRVTHVIVTAKVDAPSTEPDAPPSTLAAYLQGQSRNAALRKVSVGGGLAAGKIRQEIGRVASSTAAKVKYVTAKWVLDSIDAGKRLNEKPYMDWRFVEARQGSVIDYFGAGKRLDENITCHNSKDE
jgi:hypothetical protein